MTMTDELASLLEQIREGQHLVLAELRALRQVLELSRRRDIQQRRLSRTEEVALRVARGRRAGQVRDRIG